MIPTENKNHQAAALILTYTSLTVSLEEVI